MGGRLRQAVLTLLRLHGLCGERKALMAVSHLCLERGIKKECCCSSTPDFNGRGFYFFSLRTPLNGSPSILLFINLPVSASLLTQRPVFRFRTWLRLLTAPFLWPSPLGGLVALSLGFTPAPYQAL